MADFKISDLPLANPMTGTELMEVVQGGVSKKAVIGTAATKDVATNAQAIAGTAGVLPDAEQVHLAIRGLSVGTVSQSGGVPTGAIIERGSNANGEYVKFADGTMICVSTNRSLVFENASNMRTTWTYPASFASISFVTGNLISSALGITRQFSQIGAYDRNTTWAYVSALSLAQFVSGDAALGTMDCYAIGRWY